MEFSQIPSSVTALSSIEILLQIVFVLVVAAYLGAKGARVYRDVRNMKRGVAPAIRKAQPVSSLMRIVLGVWVCLALAMLAFFSIYRFMP